MPRTKKAAKRERESNAEAAAGEAAPSGEPKTDAVEDDEPPAQKLKTTTKKERAELHRQQEERNKDVLRRFLEDPDSLNEGERARGETLAARAANIQAKQDAKLEARLEGQRRKRQQKHNQEQKQTQEQQQTQEQE